MLFNKEEFLKKSEIINKAAKKLGYNAHGNLIFYTVELENSNIDCEITINTTTLAINVLIDMEGWQCIPDKESLNDINLAYDKAFEVGLKIVGELVNQTLCNTSSN